VQFCSSELVLERTFSFAKVPSTTGSRQAVLCCVGHWLLQKVEGSTYLSRGSLSVSKNSVLIHLLYAIGGSRDATRPKQCYKNYNEMILSGSESRKFLFV
jgi:hypothetical protein